MNTMCMIDDSERYDVYTQRWVMASRKAHVCGECSRRIEVGEQYRHTSGLADDYWFVNHICHHCTFATRWLANNCNGYLDQGVYEDIKYHLEEEAYNWPSTTKMAMCRVAIGMARQWEKRDGTLMKLPREIPDLTKEE